MLGPYSRSEESIFPPEFHLEDPFIWKTDRGWDLIAKDMEGNVAGTVYAGIHAYSPDGIEWELDHAPLAYSRTIRWDDGLGEVGHFERPFLLIDHGVPTHMFAAVADGEGGFSTVTDTWNAAIPLKRPTELGSTRSGVVGT
ncbi:hypothetical protein [Microbacterium sp. PMB16]|uniref:hypothetical protein n=1 Tax=Microbacterium sp. PMB16 TaxID=3120157 RepID=UPI003F4C4254